MRKKVSVAIVALNEEDRLPDCLRSISFADEILVVDSGSTDNTRRIARSFGARVIHEAWRGYSGQKQFAVDHCESDWVLILDADERVPAGTGKKICEKLSEDDSRVGAYRFRRKNYLHGRWIRHCGWWPDRIVRLVRRQEGAFDHRPVHEKWVTGRKIEDLDAIIEHMSFRNYSELVAKMETYSNLAARDMFEKGISVGSLAPVFRGSWMFFRTFFLELGVMDGFDGFVISATNAGGSFFKYAKLREHHMIQQSSSMDKDHKLIHVS